MAVQIDRTLSVSCIEGKGILMKVYKLLLAAVGASALLGSLVATASARNFSIDNQSLRATFRDVEFHLPAGSVRCEVILEGSFHRRTMAKVSGSLIGYITRAVLGPCGGGTASIQLETLPWHIRYSGFQGALPNIISLITHIIEVGIRIREVNGIACLFRSSAAQPVIAKHHRDVSNHFKVSLSGTIGASFECFNPTISLDSDSAQVVLLGTAIETSLMLI